MTHLSIILLFKRQLLQAGTQLLCLALPDRQLDAAGIVESLIHDARIHLLDNPHHIIHHRIGEIIGYDFLYLLRYLLAMRQGIYRCFTIGNDQSAGSQLDSSEISDDNNQDIRQFCLCYLSQGLVFQP